MKFVGVAYLIYMAWSMWRDKETLTAIGGQHPRSALRVVYSAVLINLLNPKLTIFFFAFLPQRVNHRSAHQLRSMLSLGAVFMVMTFVVRAFFADPHLAYIVA